MTVRITSIAVRLRGTSAVRNFTFELPLAVLTAPAAGGKTILLDAMRSAAAMTQAPQDVVDVEIHGPWDINHDRSALMFPLRDGEWLTPSAELSANDPDHDLLEALWPRDKPIARRQEFSLPTQERFLLNFARLLSLRRRLGSFPLVLDAPLSVLDRANAARLVGALQRENGQVILLEKPERIGTFSSDWKRGSLDLADGLEALLPATP